MTSFADFGFLSSLRKSLRDQGLKRPTEIQTQAIPLILGGQSVVGIAETGGGKTLTYALPILQMLKTLENEGHPVRTERAPRAVILAPTRELGEQISRVFKSFTHDTRLRIRSALGGTTLEQARRNSSDLFEVLLATPGRLRQMLDRGLIDFSDLRLLVLDEADQLVDEGFLNVTKAIAAACPKDVATALFSATISPGVQELITDLIPSAGVVRTSGSGQVVATLTTQNVKVEDGKRWPLLERLLARPSEGGTLLFTNTREQCDRLAKQLNDAGHRCVIYRGEMDKLERRANLKKFRTGEVRLLVSTDLAARGLDVPEVGRVINYHLPQDVQNYLHRAGRTARAGRPGLVVNLVTARDLRLIAKVGGDQPRYAERRVSAPPKSLLARPRRKPR